MSIAKVQSLEKRFPAGAGYLIRPSRFVHAVNGVSFHIGDGESLGLVGESGSGKTTIGKLLLKLYKPDSGGIFFNAGEGLRDISTMNRASMRAFRRKVQMIFQDPYESLNPRLTVFDAVSEPLLVHGASSKVKIEEETADMLRRVGLSPPEQYLFRYPHELSGGQRQRVSIARALILRPSLIVADEPTSMLDVSVRAGILELMSDLRRHFRMGYLFITHNLAVARYVCDRIAVIYMGKIVETGSAEEIIKDPLHPYTKALVESVPIPDPLLKRKKTALLAAPAQNDLGPRTGCVFFPRCPFRRKECSSEKQELMPAGAGRTAACRRLKL